jgi:hypothetical protein
VSKENGLHRGERAGQQVSVHATAGDRAFIVEDMTVKQADNPKVILDG